MKSIRDYINLIQESELVNPKVTTKTAAKLKTQRLQDFFDKNIGKDSASGAYAYARDLNPHQIRLISYVPSVVGTDPKLAYLQAVAPLMGANPFVPAVDEIQLVQARNLPGMQKPTYTMQRLLKYTQVPPLNLYATCKPILTSFGVNTEQFDKEANDLTEKIMSGQVSSLELHTYSPHQPEVKQQASQAVNEFVLEFIKLLVTCLNRSQTTDNDLQAVLTIIFELANKHENFFLDLTRHNIMFRSIGNRGYQLVITDPLGDITVDF